ncbi:hypothetical protein WR25_18873 isoform A [Diploscapter pachys]|uniref:Carboxypeptidase n=2 Tax=Diploscapter pachys TaxID=2018661 RepID=A0A2A2LM27_9BILA|nr:hypothetical protein WR25_18873 isoform A [Diploscapter pachys]
MVSSIPLLLCLIGLVPLSFTQEIRGLPGLGFSPNFKSYSGFFKVSDTHFLHYWFVESQNNPSTDPVMFWFNGGPGCSSLDGLLNEMGPYVANDDGKTLRKNPWAWNRLASVIYIEAPAGVGYSYSTDGNVTTNDDQTSAENYEAFKLFFKTFPKYRNHSVYIFGESYGGVYVPTLTARVVDGQEDFPVNLKGMGLGNGYVNEKLNIDTSVRYAYGHGIIDEKVWNELEQTCCRGCIDGCDLTQVTGHCADMVVDIFNFLWSGGLNPYDLYRDCDPSPTVNSARMQHMLRGVAPYMGLLHSAQQNLTQAERMMKFLKQNAPLYGDAPCMNDTALMKYMNSKEVRKSINIPDEVTQRWEVCSDSVTGTYQKQYGDMAPFIKKIVNNHVRVILYYGDVDMACNFMMGQQFAAGLGLKRRLGKTPWKYDKQIGGFKTVYNGLQFVTIRGAGHMAPQWRAPQMFYMVQQFLLNHPI